MEEILETPGEPVQLPDDDYVIRPELVQKAVQLRTIPPAARGALAEDTVVVKSPTSSKVVERREYSDVEHGCMAIA